MPHVAHHDIIQNAIAKAIRGLALEDLGQDEIYVENSYAIDGVNRRGIALSKSTERPLGGTMGMNETGYPVVVVMLDGGLDGTSTPISFWRQAIVDEFRDRREPIINNLENVSPGEIEVVICRVDFGDNYLDKFWQEAWDANHLVIWCYARTVRPTPGSTSI